MVVGVRSRASRVRSAAFGYANIVPFVAFALFLVVKAINTARKTLEREKAAAPPPLTTEQKLLTEIRDTLRKGQA